MLRACARAKEVKEVTAMTSTLSRTVAEYSIILGGRVGVGKTSLYHRLLYDSFFEEPRTPSREDGLERGVYSMQVNGENVKVRVTIVNCPVKSWPYTWARLYYNYMEYSNVHCECSAP